MEILLNPNVAYLLLVAGLLIAALALLTPGTGVLEFITVVCFIFLAYAMLRIPVNLWALGILILSLGGLFWLRRTQRPIFLILVIAGLEFGSVYLFRGHGLRPAVNPILALPIVLMTASFFWFVSRKLLEAERLQPVHDLGLLIGEIGEAKTAIHADGSVQVGGELWSAQSEQPIEAGSRIRVVGRDGFVLKVVAYRKDGNAV